MNLLHAAPCQFPVENKFATAAKPRACSKPANCFGEIPSFDAATQQYGNLNAKMCIRHACLVAVDKFCDIRLERVKQQRLREECLERVNKIRFSLLIPSDRIVVINAEEAPQIYALIRTGFAGIFEGAIVDRRREEFRHARLIPANDELEVPEPKSVSASSERFSLLI